MPLVHRKVVRGLIVAAVVALLAIQFMPVERFNPPTVPERALAAHAELPADVRAVLDRSCRDCHSNETRWPWYSRVAPSSWFMAEHVADGRRRLNFSEWGGYDTAKRVDTLEEICGETREGKMPLKSYLLLHRSARLTPAEIDSICSWTTAARGALERADGHQRAADRGR